MADCGYPRRVLSIAGEIVSVARSLIVILPVLALLVSGCAKREGPRHAARLVCYLDELGSGSNCSMMVHDPNQPPSANVVITTRSMTCGWPGKVSEIRWRFFRRKGAKDIYHFERRFPADAINPQVTSHTVAFDGAQVVVFEDAHQVIVLDTPR